LSTKLRLLIDADVDPALVKRIAEHSAFNVKYAREIEGLRSDDDVMDYANRDERLVLTLDADFNRHNYRICTHNGIIRFTYFERVTQPAGGLLAGPLEADNEEQMITMSDRHGRQYPFSSRRCWRALALCLLVGLLGFRGRSEGAPQANSPRPSAQVITVDATAPAHPFPHYWEKMFGSGRAVLSLRESYRHDLREVKKATGFEYIRFHAILHDEIGLYDEDEHGDPVYNYSYVDQVYDGLLENGIRPFVELSFMPEKLASTPSRQAFWYKPFNSPPMDWDRWADMIEHFARHLVDRYGIDEVAAWYFEVWNEPNIDFWAGNPKEATYYHLYDVTARSVKGVSPRLRVGGPSTAQAAWVDRFIKHCADANVPVDFVSTHVYANDTAEDVFGTHEEIPRDVMVYRAVSKVHNQVKASARPDLPIIFSEYNASYKNEIDVTDSAFMGPWLANTLRQCDGLVEMMAYWDFSDVFEEQGVVKRPFYGGYGLIAVGGIPKASYNAFRLLHELGTQRLALDSDSALVTRRTDGSLAIAAWNYAPPGNGGEPKQVTLVLQGLKGAQQARIQIVDRDHGNALPAWTAMGKPDFPNREQQERLRKAAGLTTPETRRLSAASPSMLMLALAPQSLALVEITE
jgi:xylan 1,4-beta-xylosidase